MAQIRHTLTRAPPHLHGLKLSQENWSLGKTRDQYHGIWHQALSRLSLVYRYTGIPLNAFWFGHKY